MRRVPRIDPPWPLDAFALVGHPVLDFERLWGLCFVDTIVLATEFVAPEAIEPNLFHECVHVAQYQEFGVVGFMRRYVGGWVDSGYRYAGIGLERQAFTLQHQFENGAPPCSVEAEVVTGHG